jgi:hypothetical protein
MRDLGDPGAMQLTGKTTPNARISPANPADNGQVVENGMPLVWRFKTDYCCGYTGMKADPTPLRSWSVLIFFQHEGPVAGRGRYR